MAKVDVSECQVCGVPLKGRSKVEVGDQVFCSKACADEAARQHEQPEQHPQR